MACSNGRKRWDEVRTIWLEADLVRYTSNFLLSAFLTAERRTAARLALTTVYETATRLAEIDKHVLPKNFSPEESGYICNI
jgi:hypothetical protein